MADVCSLTASIADRALRRAYAYARCYLTTLHGVRWFGRCIDCGRDIPWSGAVCTKPAREARN